VTPTKRESTQRQEKSRANILIQSLGKYSLAAITPDVIAKYRDQRLAGGRTRKGVFIKRSNNTVRLELALLGHLFTTAIREWRMGILYNPVANVRKPSPGQGRTRRLSSDEEKKLLAQVDQHSNPMLGWIVRLALQTGMRLSEITRLRIGQVDIERRIVRLTLTKNGSDRTVPLTKLATEVMRAALAHPVRPDDTELIFFGEPGRNGIRGPYCFKKYWDQAIRKCEIKDFRFHDLRHEAVSRFVEAGLGDQEVAAISGHRSMQMLRRYTHLRAEDLVSRLDGLQARKSSASDP
jgi:integrase